MPESIKLPIEVVKQEKADNSVSYLIKLTKKGARLYSGMVLQFDPEKEKLEIIYEN